ncbi:hypothetical protein ACHAWF_018096 [Thalassiosira exigua]
MTKDSSAPLLLILLLGGISFISSRAGAADVPGRPSPQQAKTIQTLMCTTESCTEADENTPGCKKYVTPIGTCYNAKELFPGDESWSDVDIYDEMIMRNLRRTFYKSKDGSCAGRGKEAQSNTMTEPVDGNDSFILPTDECVGPFGPPRPWGKFTLLFDDEYDSEEAELLTLE